MKRGIEFEGLVRFVGQERRNNSYFFQDCPVNRQTVRAMTLFMSFCRSEPVTVAEAPVEKGGGVEARHDSAKTYAFNCRMSFFG